MSIPSQFRHLPPMIPPEKAGGEWTVDADWVSPPLDGVCVEIKRGFQTDGVSIPRVAWRLIGHPFQVPLLGPALCHDALYAGELVVGHHEADWMFLSWMQQAGIGWAKRNSVWSAVRSCGGWTWDRHSRASVTKARMYCRLIISDDKATNRNRSRMGHMSLA